MIDRVDGAAARSCVQKVRGLQVTFGDAFNIWGLHVRQDVQTMEVGERTVIGQLLSVKQ